MAAVTAQLNSDRMMKLAFVLVRYLLSIGCKQTAGPEVKLQWYEKSYGSSQMKQIEKNLPAVKQDVILKFRFKNDRSSIKTNKEIFLDWHKNSVDNIE